jgi:membrane protein
MPAWFSPLQETASRWSEHKDARLGAALAYYSIFSIGPLIIIAITIAGLVFGAEAVQAQVFGALHGLLGDSGTQAIDAMLKGANRPREGIFATVIGVGALVFAAVGVVVQLKDALNTVWEVESPPGSGIWRFVRTYIWSLAGVLSLGFLLLVSMLLTAGLSAAGKYIAPYLPEAMLQMEGFLASFAVIAVLCHDVQMAARYAHCLAGRVARGDPHRRPVRSGQIPDRPLHRQARSRINLRRRGLDRDRAHLGLLHRPARAHGR